IMSAGKFSAKSNPSSATLVLSPRQPGEATTMDDTLEDYLMRAEAAGAIDFHLRIVRSPQGKLDFYIHPQDRDGETGDFSVSGGFVTKVPDNLAAGSSRKMAKPLLGS